MTASRNNRRFKSVEAYQAEIELNIECTNGVDVYITVKTSTGNKQIPIKKLASNNHIWKELALAYQHCAKDKSSKKYVDTLRHVAKYLASSDKPYSSLSDIDDTFFRGYGKYLQNLDITKSTKQNYYCDIGVIFKKLDELQASTHIRRLPRIHFTDNNHTSVKTSKISESELLDIVKAAAVHCNRIMKDFATAQLIIRLKNLVSTGKTRDTCQSIGDLLQYASTNFDDFISNDHLTMHPKNGALTYKKSELVEYFFPTADSLLPFQ